MFSGSFENFVEINFERNPGALCEQLVGQLLLNQRELFEQPQSLCWIRQRKTSNAEVDYLISEGSTIIPVEVKAGKTGSLKSLQLFLQEKNLHFGLRFDSDLPSIVDTKTSLPNVKGHPYRLLSLPFYLISETKRLCRENMITE